MKKIFFVLLIAFSFMTGCATIAQKYREPGRHFWNIEDATVEAEQDLEKISRKYRITEPIKVAVVGADQAVVEHAKEVFNDFGFDVVFPEYQGYVNYVIQVLREDLAQKVSGSYGLGYSGRQKVVIKAKILVVDKKTGVENQYDGVQDYSSRRYYRGYYHQSRSRQADPGYIAFKGALMEAIGEFIDAQRIAHRQPKKK